MARKKVVLAYSGGLDTSIILKWLQEARDCDVIAYVADVGQGDDMAEALAKARALGAVEAIAEDLRETFAKDYVFPMLRADAVYEGAYRLGTSIARPLIALRQVALARELGADALSHGATGKGNDQVRFELAYAALDPDLAVIAPWREWDLVSRSDLVAYAEQHQIPIPRGKRGEPPFSIDANLLHVSSEGKVLEDPALACPREVQQITQDPRDAPDEAQEIVLAFAHGDPVALDGEALSPATMMARLNLLGGTHGIGRLDYVENRFVGIKSRGFYETPGGTIVAVARQAVESLTLDAGSRHLKDDLMPRYARVVYQGFWFAPERLMLQAAIDASQAHVGGEVRLRLYKGGCSVVSRSSPYSLYSEALATFEGGEGYDQADAAGFIRLNGLRLATLARRKNTSVQR